ncbi:AlpA family phage regulatory protein [Stenotrophomonas sp. ATCM1_4]|uniref:helix-turn-helix transcriptional regulator n=1 Tax=Stenotrophomonas sp. ATCM1_4 TaxID=2259330 RepID=UPI00104CCBC6|nr:AlpA family phage regulatory protein [Stenotrophomonas sp. ATCM1_4]TDB29742.1 AlpA family phage regulatory protein [Stenotrophomonas sp. ATCM1_4]
MSDKEPERLLTIHSVCDQAGVRTSYIYERMKEGKFPKSIRVGRRAMWLQSEIQSWIRQQVEANRGSQPGG